MGSEDVGVVGGDAGREGTWSGCPRSARDRMPNQSAQWAPELVSQTRKARLRLRTLLFHVFVYFWLGWILAAAWAFRCRLSPWWALLL